MADVTARLMPDVSESDPEKLLHRVHELMAANGVTHVYFQFVSLNGRVLGKAVPVAHFDRVSRSGARFHPGVSVDVPMNASGQAAGYGLQAQELVARPDLATFRVLPWDTRFARVLCDLTFREDGSGPEAGLPVPTDTRGNLKRVTQELATRKGLTLKSGCEPEMMWFKSHEQITRASVDPGNMDTGYHLRHLDGMRSVIAKVTEYGIAMGLDMTEADYEDPRQLEMTFAYDECLATADRLITFRQICSQVARELDFVATFMPKPINGVSANGCHHNLSLWSAEGNVLVDADNPDQHLSEVGRHIVGGLLEHTRGMTALMAPTVNSYVRFRDEGAWAPAISNWGFDNKTCAIRVCGDRLEYKQPDASVNPYLSHAAIIAAIEDGIDRQLDPGPPEAGNSYDPSVQATALARFPAQPRTLGEAIDALDEDKVISGAFPPELYRVFRASKESEWARSCGAVTDWQLAEYLDYLT